MIMMFKEFQGEFLGGDGCGGIFSICLNMGKCPVEGIMNSNNHSHSSRV